MSKVVLVSGSDSNYFPLLLEWVYSVRAFPQSRDMDICILDAGLTPEQVATLRPLVRHIHKPDWPCPIPARKIRGREYLKSCVCRPFINRYFPGYDIYFWMDADTWVQDWRGPELFLKGAEQQKITLTAQVDRAYPRQLRVKWLGRWPWKVRGFYFSNAVKAFGFRKAKELLPYYVLLAGAFALHKDAPHWEHWQTLVIEAVKKGKVFTAEQLTLGIMCHLENYEFEVLPAWCHWLCQFKPKWDEKRGVFVEPSLPHETIGILHLSGYDEMRLDRTLKTDFKTLENGVILLSYRYPHYDSERQQPHHEPKKAAQ